MPVHIGELESQVDAIDGDLPLSDEQIERLFRMFEQRLERRRRQAEQARAATCLRTSSAPPTPIKE